jgi:hypothetical protein
MELGFEAVRAVRPASVRQRRLARARWWFAQMHRIVDQACDWPAATATRPAQAYLALAKGRF